jgi:hypothetical protein
MRVANVGLHYLGFGIVIRRQIDIEDADGIASFQELSGEQVTEITCSTGN